MREKIDFIVLLGPSGAGKSYIGKVASSLESVEFISGEKYLMERYGGVEGFLPVKDQALKDLYLYIEQRLYQINKTIIFEGTGLSDQAHIEYLLKKYSCLLIEVATSKENCLQQVSTREKGINFNSDPKYTGNFYDFWHQKIRPKYHFDEHLENNTLSIEEIQEFFKSILKCD